MPPENHAMNKIIHCRAMSTRKNVYLIVRYDPDAFAQRVCFHVDLPLSEIERLMEEGTTSALLGWSKATSDESEIPSRGGPYCPLSWIAKEVLQAFLLVMGPGCHAIYYSFRCASDVPELGDHATGRASMSGAFQGSQLWAASSQSPKRGLCNSLVARNVSSCSFGQLAILSPHIRRE
jgi:hypothetical protein